jgi:hypothetical protein
MRLFRAVIAIGALALAAIPFQRLQAETRVFVVYGNLGNNDELTRNRLQEQLRRFAVEVKRHRLAQPNPPTINFRVVADRELDADAAQVVSDHTRRLWSSRADAVAFVWGFLDSGRGQEVIPTGNIYIGVAPMDSLLPTHTRHHLFGPVRGHVSPQVELDAYEIIIGYALLRRMWRERRYALLQPIAEVLVARMQLARQRGSFGSWAKCLREIRRSLNDIVRIRPATGAAPRAVSAEEVSCT